MASMEKFKLGFRSLASDISTNTAPVNSSGFSSSSDQAHVLVHRAPVGRVVSVSTCSKICAISFVVGVFVGFTLKRRVRRWASKLLKRLKDD
ncbi:hypothetical protein MUK42_33320 [Musa troglodytarum]|uniref:Transmembrane protein n=1 Tax=Musa troglodytarum TaxID=320322 RepID=A0A9E7EZW0_9LILI|nr:hypothetical protein MUK42_33320 [Musa troglodytarum]